MTNWNELSDKQIFFSPRRLLFYSMNTTDLKMPEKLYFKIYPTYIQGSREQLKKVNKHTFYRISVWEGEKLLGEMLEGASPAILIDKIYLTKALINFTQEFQGKKLVIKLTEHYNEDHLLGVGTYDLEPIRKRYLEKTQRFNSQQEVSLSTNSGKMKLVFSIFLESDRYLLEQYVRKFKQNQKNVMRAKRNINNYKRQMINKSAEREREASKTKKNTPKKKLSDIKETKNESGIEKEQILQNQQNQDQVRDLKKEVRQHFYRNNKARNKESAPNRSTGGYLQLDSAARFHTKLGEKNTIKPTKPSIQSSERQFQANSTVMNENGVSEHFIISALDLATQSLISDGSEESEMRMNNQKITYSEKALKKFKMNLNICFNILLVIIGVLLIYSVIAPSKKYTKPERSLRGEKGNHELFDI